MEDMSLARKNVVMEEILKKMRGSINLLSFSDLGIHAGSWRIDLNSMYLTDLEKQVLESL